MLEPRTLSAAYERCRQLHARHGRTYYLATLLLPRWKRRHVHALYGFVRYADEIVDDLASTLDGPAKAAALHAWGRRFYAGLQGAPCDDPVLPAVLHTVRAFDLNVGDVERFLHSMAMDLRTDGYATYDDLCDYMEGSAAVIGTMMAPILESCDPPAAREHARQLGLAFQLTNFIRDVAEDLLQETFLRLCARGGRGIRHGVGARQLSRNDGAGRVAEPQGSLQIPSGQ